jgi:NADPH:quinone reductase-like Zn-dependent oxidoreductase
VKAVQYHRYGPPEVLQVVDIPEPVPAGDQAVVRVIASSVNPVDWHSIRGEPRFARVEMGLRHPKRAGIGADLAGIVESVGSGVTNVKRGDEVLGMSVATWAELAAVKAEGLVPKPTGASWQDAGAVGVAGLTALQGLRDKGGVGPGQRVLVAGAGGGVGHFAVQIAVALGAKVTASTSAANLEMVRSLGADEVVDYAAADATAEAGRYDLIFDAGGWLTLRQLGRGLRPQGVAVLAGAGPHPTLLHLASHFVAAGARTRFGERRYVSYLAHRKQADLQFLAELMASGNLRPVIDRTYPSRRSVQPWPTRRPGGRTARSR